MAIGRRRFLAGLGLALAGLAKAADGQTADADDVTEAEKLLFETDHLSNVAASTRLEYRYSRDGDPTVIDRIQLDLDARRTLVPDYLSGERHINFPSIEDAHGNPLLLFFLEADLRDMQRRTHGQADYFRRVIRRAMASPQLKIEETEAESAGRRFAAKRVVVEPFRADQSAPARYPDFVGKRYEFLMAPSVPGQIFRLATIVPLPGGKKEVVSIEWTAAIKNA